MPQAGVGTSRGGKPQRSCVQSWGTAPCVASSPAVCGQPQMMRWRRVCVGADPLSLTPLLRYDGHTEYALSPTPDARDAQALQLHVGDRVVLTL